MKNKPTTPSDINKDNLNEEELLCELQKAYTSLGRLKNSVRHKKIVLDIDRKVRKIQKQPHYK